MAAQVSGDEAVGVGGDGSVVVEVCKVENSGEFDSAGLDGIKRQDVVVYRAELGVYYEDQRQTS